MAPKTHRFYVPNDKLAVEPFPKNSTTSTKVVSGFASIQSLAKLVPLKVIYGNEDFPEGSVVYLSGDKSARYKKSYSLDDVKFILVSTADVELVDYRPEE